MSDPPPNVGPVDEYATLRSELLESRKYVFERPLLIVTLAVGGLTALEDHLRVLLPPLIAALVLFNFWFTVNRLLSAARIVAYIQLVLEERAYPWVGWETSLRAYRRWIKDKSQDKERLILSEVERSVVPDALTYYPSIFLLHIGVAVFAFATSVLGALDGAFLNRVCAGASLLLMAWIGGWALRYPPGRMQTMIERNRVIWREVFRSMKPAAGA